MEEKVVEEVVSGGYVTMNNAIKVAAAVGVATIAYYDVKACKNVLAKRKANNAGNVRKDDGVDSGETIDVEAEVIVEEESVA